MAMLTVAPMAAEANGYHHGRRSEVEADIDELKARMHFENGQWILSIKYEVEIEDAWPEDRFELILALTEGRRPLIDPSGRPMVMNIPLDQPQRVKDGGEEIIFRDTIVVPVQDGLFGRPKDLRVDAHVVPFGGGPVLDQDDTDVDVYHVRVIPVPPPPPPPVMYQQGGFIQESGFHQPGVILRQGGFVRRGVVVQGGRFGPRMAGAHVSVRW